MRDLQDFLIIAGLMLLAGGALLTIRDGMKPKPPTKCDSCQHLKRVVSNKYICPHLTDGYSYEGAIYCVNYCRRKTHEDEE